MKAPSRRHTKERRATYAVRPRRRVAERLPFPQAQHLTHKERIALEAYKNYLLEKLPNEIERIVLFGSKARGDAAPDSDLDLLVVIGGEAMSPLPQDSRWRTITHARDDLDSKYGVYLSPIVKHVEDAKKWSPLLDHVVKEGIELWCRPGTRWQPWPEEGERAMAMSKEEHVNARMAIARDKLTVARDIFAKQHYNDVISTAYYAMFYASKALLLALGEDPHKHKGVVNLYGEKIAKVDLGNRKYGALLAKMKDLREDADYEDFFHATKQQAEDAIIAAEDFVNESEKILQKIRARG